MLREDFRLFQRCCLFLDMCGIALAWTWAYWVRFDSGWIPVYFGIPAWNAYLAHLPLVLFIWIAVFAYSGVYHTGRWWNFFREGTVLLRNSAIAMVLLVCFTYLSS